MAMNAETRIGDLKIEVSKLPAMQALTLSTRIGRLVGPAIVTAFAAGSVAEANVELVARALLGTLEPKEIAGTLRDLFEGTQINGSRANEVFDVVFADQLELVIPLVTFVIKHQFGSFGRALLAAGGALMPKAEPKANESNSTKS
jgi:hypothetical protein